jgi:hypothetical protein
VSWLADGTIYGKILKTRGKTAENYSKMGFLFPIPLPNQKKSLPLRRFLKHLFVNMPHIFGNRVYLNIKERDRFF